jgi:hypothetical protein
LGDDYAAIPTYKKYKFDVVVVHIFSHVQPEGIGRGGVKDMSDIFVP